MAVTDNDRILMKAAGYEVLPDSDQPGLFLWIRSERGQIEGGSDMSLSSVKEAEEEVMEIIREVVFSESEEEITPDQWEGMPLAQRLVVIQELYGDPPL